jgi:hypothetical protein
MVYSAILKLTLIKKKGKFNIFKNPLHYKLTFSKKGIT